MRNFLLGTFIYGWPAIVSYVIAQSFDQSPVETVMAFIVSYFLLLLSHLLAAEAGRRHWFAGDRQRLKSEASFQRLKSLIVRRN